MATGQTVLDTMELLDPELQLQTGESDVAKGLVAANRAQDHFEALLAVRAKAKGGTTGELTTAASTKTTAFPTGVLRIDRLTMLSGTGGRPQYDLLPNRRAGAQVSSGGWPGVMFSVTSNGKPTHYKTNGRTITWAQVPDTIYYIEWEGFQVATDISAAGTFLYDDIVILPLATFACKIIKSGLDDSADQLSALAQETFTPVLNALDRFNRDGASGLEYTRVHTE